MRRATAVVGGCYGASRDDGGSDQGSVVVRARQVQATMEAQSCRALALAVATNGGRGSRGSGSSELL